MPTEDTMKTPQTAPAPAAPSKKSDETPVDPVTNQAITDFFPAGLADDHKAAVETQMKAMKGATGNARVGLSQNLVNTREEAKMAQEQAAEDVKAVEAETKRMFDTMTNVPPDLYYAREKARVDAEAAANTQSTTVPGGAYKQGDNWVDANGEPTDAPDGAEK